MRHTLLVSFLLVLGGLAAVPAGNATATATSSEVAAQARATCGGRTATIVGSRQGDLLRGTPGDDVIVGGRGEDSIFGRGGDDLICGGRRADVLLGGPGDDRILGGGDSTTTDKYGPYTDGDVILPGPGDDVVDAGWDPRQARNGQRPDTIRFEVSTRGVAVRLGGPGQWGSSTGEGTDRIRGQRSMDVFGTLGDDTLIGGPGNDEFLGNGGTDTMRGGPGADVLSDRDGGRRGVDADSLSGGSGDDTMSSWGGADVVRAGAGGDDISAAAADCARVGGGGGLDSLYLDGGSYDYSFDAATQQSWRTGRPPCGSGDVEEVRLASGSGDIAYRGTEGPDLANISTGPGAATVDLLGGDDAAITTDGDDAIFGGAGTDTVDAGAGFDACVDVEAGTSCESPVFPAVRTCDGLPATIVADPTRAGDSLVGTDGDDVILGSDGDDTIEAGGGNDVICGRGGSDTIEGGDGNDRLFGQDDRRFVFEDGQASYSGDTLLPGPGDDHVDGGLDSRRTDAGATGPDRISWEDAGAGIIADFASSPASVTGATSGTDTIVLAGALSVTGTRFDDVINGTESGDSIDAAGGTDSVDGRGGYDSCWRAERRTNCERH